MTPSGLSPRCIDTMPGIRHLLPHRGNRTHLKTAKETPKDQNFTGNYIWKINMRTRREQKGVGTVCQRVSHISSGNSFCSATAARTATPVRGKLRAGY